MRPFFAVTLAILLGALTPVHSCPREDCEKFRECLEKERRHRTIEDYKKVVDDYKAFIEKCCKTQDCEARSPLFSYSTCP